MRINFRVKELNDPAACRRKSAFGTSATCCEVSKRISVSVAALTGINGMVYKKVRLVK